MECNHLSRIHLLPFERHQDSLALLDFLHHTDKGFMVMRVRQKLSRVNRECHSLVLVGITHQRYSKIVKWPVLPFIGGIKEDQSVIADKAINWRRVLLFYCKEISWVRKEPPAICANTGASFICFSSRHCWHCQCWGCWRLRCKVPSILWASPWQSF